MTPYCSLEMLARINQLNEKINSLKTIKYNGYLIVLSCCLIALYALFFPALENPDEIEHVSRILYEKTVWGEIVHYA